MGRYEELLAKEKADGLTVGEAMALENERRRREAGGMGKSAKKAKKPKKTPAAPKGKVYTEKDVKAKHKGKSFKKRIRTESGSIIYK